MQNPRPEVEAVRALLDKRLRVELSDGRTVEGKLECYDDSGNMILASTADITAKVSRSTARDRHVHFMGTVLVPGHASVSIKKFRPFPSLQKEEEQKSLLHMNELKSELEAEPARPSVEVDHSKEDSVRSGPARDERT